ncbi:MAG: hypothetical protein KDE27_07430, partial [Planctomycetes bacterium]|nr:hypothetical protein [Planctomycetota bacterium]
PAPRTDPDAAGADGARGVATYGSPPTTHFVPADESAAAGAAPLREQAAAGPVRSDTAPSASSGTLGQNEKAGAALEPPAAAAKVAEPAAKPVTGPPAAVGERSAGAKSGSDDFFLGAGRRKASESETPSAQTATPENPDRDGDRGVARNEQQQAVGDRRIVGITLLDKAGARPSVTLPYLQLTREFEPAPGTRYEPTDKDQARSGGDAPNARPKSRAPGYRGSGYGAPGYRGPGDAIPPPGAGAGPTTGGPTGPSAPGPAGPSSPPPAGPRTAHSGSGPATPGPASPGPSTPAGLGGKAVPDTDPEALRLRTNTRARNLRHPIRSTVSLVPFVSDQLESGDVAATAVPTVLTIGTLRCEDVTDRFAPAAPAAAGGGAAVSERFWLVEGDAAEVGELMQRLANIARENGYLLANGELGLPAPTATRSDEVAEVERAAVKAESRAEEKDAGKQRDDRPAESALATMRLVLRFRALPKSR